MLLKDVVWDEDDGVTAAANIPHRSGKYVRIVWWKLSSIHEQYDIRQGANVWRYLDALQVQCILYELTSGGN